jgi:uncharacterized protein (TIGR00290 family)
MKKAKAIFCWSGGKDSALALNRILKEGQLEVVCLLTTINEHFQRISMHGVRESLLDQQAAAIGIPLEKMFVSQKSSNEEYGARMEVILRKYQKQGVEYVIFGDIFLEDLRKWREKNLEQVGLKAIFPIWKIDTRELIQEFITLGFESVLCCINDAYLTESFVGKYINQDFLKALPSNVDPCGENGEYHSFVFAGPIFKKKVPIRIGEKVYKPIEQTHPGTSTNAVCPTTSAIQDSKPKTKGFWFCDLEYAEV